MKWKFVCLLLILLFDNLYARSPGCSPTTSTCQLEGQRVQPTQKCLGDQFRISCPPYHECDGEYVVDHSDHQGGEFEEISRGPYYTTVNITSFSDGGLYRCRKMCHDGTVGPPCNLTVEVLPTRIETDFPEAFHNERYIGKCRTTGNPVPILHIEPEAPLSDCPYTVHHNINGYTVEAVINIPNINMKCQRLHCGTTFQSETISLNIITATRVPTSEQPTQPTDTPAVPTNMTDKSAAHIVLNTTTLVLLMCSVVLSLI